MCPETKPATRHFSFRRERKKKRNKGHIEIKGKFVGSWKRFKTNSPNSVTILTQNIGKLCRIFGRSYYVAKNSLLCDKQFTSRLHCGSIHWPLAPYSVLLLGD